MKDRMLVECPGCHLKFRVPAHLLGKRARCNDCKTIFVLQAADDALEDTVAEWLSDGTAATPASQPAQANSQAATAAPPISDKKAVAAAAKKPAPAPAVEPVRLERIDDMGAYFEFPADRLEELQLRSSFGHRCVSCGTREGLRVHLLVWTDRLPARDQIRLQEGEGQLIGAREQFEGQSVEEFFGRLPNIRSLPHPYTLPFPYYVCSSCSAVGEVHTHVLIHGDKEYGQIMISNLDIAAEFLASNGGEDSEDYQMLIEAWQRQKADPWRALPLGVRNRLGQWFKRTGDERFVAYFTDEEFSKAELGTAGLVLTSRRAIYKKFAALREFDLSKPANIRYVATDKKWEIEISQPGLRPAMLNLDPQLGEKFLQRCRASWAGLHVVERPPPETATEE